MIALRDTPLDPAALLAAVADPEHGGTAAFVGTTRRESGRREGGRAALRGLRGAGADRDGGHRRRGRARASARASRWRTASGTVAVGDASVAVAASAGHRPAAFAACRYVIDELKARAPIWKQTVYADGAAAWIDGCAHPATPRRAGALACLRRPAPPASGSTTRSSPRRIPDLDEEIDLEEELWTDDSGEDYSGWYCVRTDPWPCPAEGCALRRATSSPPPTW